MDTEVKIVPKGGVCDFLPPPQKKQLIVHHGPYRDRGLVSKSCTHQKLASFARTQCVVNKASYEYLIRLNEFIIRMK